MQLPHKKTQITDVKVIKEGSFLVKISISSTFRCGGKTHLLKLVSDDK